jgi:hypothetical protein
MLCIEAVWLVVGASDLRGGMDSLLGQVATRFGSALPHHADVFANRRATRLKVLAKLGKDDALHIVDEAVSTGYGLQRGLAARGYACEVIVPSKTPRQSGQRVKAGARVDSLSS